jgi:hypothetical protein
MHRFVPQPRPEAVRVPGSALVRVVITPVLTVLTLVATGLGRVREGGVLAHSVVAFPIAPARRRRGDSDTIRV